MYTATRAASIRVGKSCLVCWQDHDPFSLGLLDVSFEVGLCALSHLLEVALVEVCKDCDARGKAFDVFLKVEAVLGELCVIWSGGAEEDGFLELFVEFGDT